MFMILEFRWKFRKSNVNTSLNVNLNGKEIPRLDDTKKSPDQFNRYHLSTQGFSWATVAPDDIVFQTWNILVYGQNVNCPYIWKRQRYLGTDNC